MTACQRNPCQCHCDPCDYEQDNEEIRRRLDAVTPEQWHAFYTEWRFVSSDASAKRLIAGLLIPAPYFREMLR